MTITAVRIDGRLIHGQVANLWSTSLGINRIMVVDDAVSKNELEKQGLKLACPGGIKLSVLNKETAVDHITRGGYDGQKLFIVVKKPQVILDLVNDGVPIKEINVGNMSQTNETTAVTNSINVVKEDVDTFYKLSELGVRINQQMVPGDQPNNFMDLVLKADVKI